MLSIDKIPHLKVYRLRTSLPLDGKSSLLNHMIFINNLSTKDSINLMNHSKITTYNKYNNYYIESKYNQKIHTKLVRLNYRKRRDDIYDSVKSELKSVKTPLLFDQLHGKNVYYDLQIFNEIFFENIKRLSIMRRIELYFDYLKILVNQSKFNDYTSRLVFIDVDSWLTSKTDKINNPISYFVLAYRKYFDVFKHLGDINFIFYNKDAFLLINPSLCDAKSLNIFKRELNKLTKTINVEDDDIFDIEVQKQEVRDNVSVNVIDKFGFTNNAQDVSADDILFSGLDTNDSDDDNSDEDEIKVAITQKVDDTISEIAEDEPEIDQAELEKKLKSKINEDRELLSTIHDTVRDKKTGKSTASLKRDAELREKQKKIKLDSMTVEEYSKMNVQDFSIPTVDVANKITTTNENVANVRFTNFEKAYNDKAMKKDTVSIFEALNDKSIPTYIKSIDVEDSSDELNYKETYRVVLEDENRVRHTVTFDVPKFVDDKFLYLNGSKKIINKQLFMKPIVKTGPDEVQVCTNYNKIFTYRVGDNVSTKIEKLKRALSNSILGITIINGDNSAINRNYKTILEYDELAKNYVSIKTGKLELLFDQNEIHKRLRDRVDENYMCIGFYNDKSPILMSYKDETIDGMDIVDFIVNSCGPKLKEVYDSTSVSSKKFIYSRSKIMNKYVPLVLLLGYCEGIITVMKKANIKYYFSDKRVRVDDTQSIIQFEDGYLIYDAYPLENSLLLNGLQPIPTKGFKFEEFDSKDIYVELFDILYKSRMLSNAFDSFYEFMIDPITKEVLTDLDYPTDFVSVMLCANALLADNGYITETNINLYRVRSNEIVNAVIHQELANAYAAYRVTANSKNPTKISIPKDAVIKKILSLNTVEEFSTLNPIYDTEKTHTISTKGLNGMNLKESYTLDKRSYDKTMRGIIGMSSSPDGNVGIARKLTLEPDINGPRGYINLEENGEKLNDVNLFTPAELLTPLGNTHDESIRLAIKVCRCIQQCM